MTTHTTPGIVLRVMEFGESDRIAVFYTREFGKISALARHAIKSRKRFGTLLNVGQVLNVKLTRRPNRQLAFLEEVRAQGSLTGVYGDWRSLMLSCVLMDFVNEMTREGSRNEEVYDLAASALSSIHYGGDLQAIFSTFQYQLLVASGFKPELDTCVVCHRPCDVSRPEQSLHWVHSAGGFHCRDCLPQGASYQRVKAATISELQGLARHGDRASVTSLSFLYDFLCHQLGHSIKSWEYAMKMGVLEAA